MSSPAPSDLSVSDTCAKDPQFSALLEYYAGALQSAADDAKADLNELCRRVLTLTAAQSKEPGTAEGTEPNFEVFEHIQFVDRVQQRLENVVKGLGLVAAAMEEADSRCPSERHAQLLEKLHATLTLDQERTAFGKRFGIEQSAEVKGDDTYAGTDPVLF